MSEAGGAAVRSGRVRVVIGEDEPLLREGIAVTLERAGMVVAGAVGDANELVRLAESERPDVVLTDIRMPPGNADDGLQAAIAIRARRPETGVLVVSQHVQRRYALELVADRPGGVGYLLKQRIGDVDTFCSEVRRVAEGGTVLDPEVVSAMLAHARRDDDALDRLTPRQREVLALVAEGRSNGAIARRLFLTEKAVVQHVSRVYRELGLAASDEDHRRVLAVVRYLSR
jgi:DNA-binding NarL/FixJ family response regulator